MIPLLELSKYPLPAFLEGKFTHLEYFKWLRNKADTLLKRDRKRRKPYAASATKSSYRQEVHKAIINGGERDPYTGESLEWELISKWDTSHEQPEGYKKRFALMPTVDHVNADELKFEICSFRINEAKADLKPEEFIELCKKVAGYRFTAIGFERHPKRKRLTPKVVPPQSTTGK
jgi:hypothetical protein